MPLSPVLGMCCGSRVRCKCYLKREYCACRCCKPCRKIISSRGVKKQKKK